MEREEFLNLKCRCIKKPIPEGCFCGAGMTAEEVVFMKRILSVLAACIAAVMLASFCGCAVPAANAEAQTAAGQTYQERLAIWFSRSIKACILPSCRAGFITMKDIPWRKWFCRCGFCTCSARIQ